LENGALGHVAWLLERHPQLIVSLFVTADWRELSPTVTRHWLARITFLKDRLYLTKVRPKGSMRLDRHPRFVDYLCSMPHVECELHGLDHINRGVAIPVEFYGRSTRECERRLRAALEIFKKAGIPNPSGLCPPSWELTPELYLALHKAGLRWVASARDIRTPITEDAYNTMSGLRGASLLYPERLDNGLLHFTTNFQATSTFERAREIVELGGLLAVKAHIVKEAFGFVMLDGMDQQYRDRLHALFTMLEDCYGERLWWTSMRQIANRCWSRSDSIAEEVTHAGPYQ